MTVRRVALVTGASRGLGKACAVELARAGFDVAVAARTFVKADQRSLPGNVSETAEAVVAAGGAALPVRLDLDDHASIDASVAAVMHRFGRIDLLVNNAFYQTRESQALLTDMSVEHLAKQIRVNLVAPMVLARAVLPQMLARGGGTIIDMVSGAGVHELDRAPGKRSWGIGYGVSKTGMIEIAAMVASQYGDKGIRAFSVQPGTVMTEQLAASLGTAHLDRETLSPPDHAARTIAWLATHEEAAAMNGGLIHAPTFARSLSRQAGVA